MEWQRTAPVVAFCILFVCTAASQTSPKRPPVPTGHLIPGHDMSNARGGHTATILPDFMVLIAGGKDAHGTILASTEIYDPTSEAFTPGAKMSMPREGHVAAPLGDGKVLIAGGVTRSGTALSSSEDYDYESGKFTSRGNMHSRRIRPTATVLRDGRVLVTGGSDGSAALDSAETYDLLTGKWTVVGKMSSARMGHTATLLSDGRVLVVGGMGGGRSLVASADVFDPASNHFSAVAKLNQARFLHAAILLASGKVLVAGGAQNAKGNNLSNSVELFDAANHSFTLAGKINEGRMKMADAASLLDGRVLIAGGASSAEIYDPKNSSSGPVSGALDAPRFYPAAIQLMDRSVRIFGGYDPSGISTAKTWIYRP